MSLLLPKFAALKLNGLSSIDFAQRLFSRNLSTMEVSSGRLSLFLSADGKIEALFWMIRLEAGLLLVIEQSQIALLHSLIEKYHFAEPFTLEVDDKVWASWRPTDSDEIGTGKYADSKFIGIWRGIEFTFEFGNSPAKSEDRDDWDLHRIKNMIPQAGEDFTASTLVFDVGFEELCDAGKGCYVGQEVVERVRTRGGNVPKKLTLFHSPQNMGAGEPIKNQSGEAIGNLTSSVAKNDDGFYALGFSRRGTCNSGDEVVTSSGHFWVCVRQKLVNSVK